MRLKGLRDIVIASIEVVMTTGKLQEVDLFLPKAPRRSARITPRLTTTKLLCLKTIRKTPKKPPQWMDIAARIRAGLSAQGITVNSGRSDGGVSEIRGA
jgi:hypothetical protein